VCSDLFNLDANTADYEELEGEEVEAAKRLRNDAKWINWSKV
jgi:hypothetical protein